jgi:hypothetical protein
MNPHTKTTSSTEAQQSIKIVTLYEDLSTGYRAKRFADHLAGKLYSTPNGVQS